MTIRDATSADLPSILQLNQQSVHFLSPLDQARLEKLHGALAWHREKKCWGQSKLAAQFLI